MAPGFLDKSLHTVCYGLPYCVILNCQEKARFLDQYDDLPPDQKQSTSLKRVAHANEEVLGVFYKQFLDDSAPRHREYNR